MSLCVHPNRGVVPIETGACGLDLSPLDCVGVNSANSCFSEYFLGAFTLNPSPSDFLRGSVPFVKYQASLKAILSSRVTQNFCSNLICVDFIVGTKNNCILQSFKVSPHADCKGNCYKTSYPQIEWFYIAIIYSHLCEAGHLHSKLLAQLGLSPCYRLGLGLLHMCSRENH